MFSSMSETDKGTHSVRWLTTFSDKSCMFLSVNNFIYTLYGFMKISKQKTSFKHLLNCSESAKKSDITSFELFVFNLFLIINYKTIKVCLFGGYQQSIGHSTRTALGAKHSFIKILKLTINVLWTSTICYSFSLK